MISLPINCTVHPLVDNPSLAMSAMNEHYSFLLVFKALLAERRSFSRPLVAAGDKFLSSRRGERTLTVSQSHASLAFSLWSRHHVSPHSLFILITSWTTATVDGDYIGIEWVSVKESPSVVQICANQICLAYNVIIFLLIGHLCQKTFLYCTTYYKSMRMVVWGVREVRTEEEALGKGQGEEKWPCLGRQHLRTRTTLSFRTKVRLFVAAV